MSRAANLALLAITLLLVAACAHGPLSAFQGSSPLAVLPGFYEGSLQSREHGEVPVSLNLRAEDDALAGTLMTPLGDFQVSHDAVTRERVNFVFTLADGERGSISATWSAEAIHGIWALADDGGAIALRRVGPAKPPIQALAPTLELSVQQWREDLHYLAQELPRRHGNAFHTVSAQEFAAAIRALDAKLPTLAGHEAFAAMGRIVAMVGDGHTYLQLPDTFHRYPIHLYAFSDGLRVTHATAEHEALLGARVLAIGGTPIAEARRLIARQIAFENEQYVLKEFAGFLVQAELLHAHGVVAELDAAEWRLQLTSGETQTVKLAPLAANDQTRWVSAAKTPPLYRQRPREDLWLAFLPETRTLYVGFRGYPSRPQFRTFFDEMFRSAATNPVERLVIDLRENAGGDFTKARDSLLPRLKQHPLNEKGRLFVVIGRHTFSAAMTTAADLMNETSATLVGEPTGARPNGWQEKGQFTLPNSRLIVSVSTKYYRFLSEDLPAVMPHQQITLTWEHLQAGRDPVLEWVVAQPLPR